jgi:hypothetical protein
MPSLSGFKISRLKTQASKCQPIRFPHGVCLWIIDTSKRKLAHMIQPAKGLVDYRKVLAEAISASHDLPSFLLEELPYIWRDAYLEMTPRPTDIIRWERGSFVYIYDDYASLEASGAVPYDPEKEARLVAALGRSEPTKAVRDDYRLRGWVGATEKMFGSDWDKGHFIAHSIGGAVDGLEANVFVQRRELNRGWSEEGKRFREMEKYCVLNPNTLCFSRPLYLDQTAKPSFVEFGVLKGDGDFWVQCFDNR